MRIVTLENSGRMYTSLAYLVLGDASQLEDVNTLVDVGADPAILASIERAPTGVGKWAVEQVVVTHSHSDHCALLPEIRAAYHPRVLAFSPSLAGVDRTVQDGETIRMGDRVFEVIHTPGHSPGHIAVVVETEAGRVVIAGDTMGPEPGWFADRNPPVGLEHRDQHILAYEQIAALDPALIIPGHYRPIHRETL